MRKRYFLYYGRCSYFLFHSFLRWKINFSSRFPFLLALHIVPIYTSLLTLSGFQGCAPVICLLSLAWEANPKRRPTFLCSLSIPTQTFIRWRMHLTMCDSGAFSTALIMIYLLLNMLLGFISNSSIRCLSSAICKSNVWFSALRAARSDFKLSFSNLNNLTFSSDSCLLLAL